MDHSNVFNARQIYCLATLQAHNDYNKGQFCTELGPVHANFVLLDEINRSSAKTQSAMLEAMQEKQTSIGGERYDLPKPFIVLATQNPIEQEGTYELPEAQLDRFLLKEVLVYPNPNEELEILKRIESGILGNQPSPSQDTSVQLENIINAQNLVNKVYIDDTIKNYIVQLVTATRNPQSVISADVARYVQYGASPRASITFQQVAKTLALISGRDYVIPEDVKQLRYSVLRHRIILNFEAIADQVHPEVIIDAIFNAVTVPQGQFVSSLLVKVKAKMAIYAHERVRGILEGEYGSVFKGRSMDFDDLREYIPGDDIKDID